MNKESKFIVGIALVTLGIVVGLAFFISTKGAKERELITSEVPGVEAVPTHYELGDVPINGGVVTKEYELKNTSGKDLELIKIVTSCMCTSANVKVGDIETRFYAMEMGGDKNPLISTKIGRDETAKVTVRFDPAAHGPKGAGPFDRIVWLYFSDGMKELTFKGVVK
jgi:hypothetical protein